jgi:ABC-type Fe3+-siderophore transport system permease subunit
MSLDLRIPMGLMFLIIGAILSLYGLLTRGSIIYQRSAGMNINLVWGGVMFVFGLAMFLLGRYSDKTPQPPSHEAADRPAPHGH